MTAPAGRGCKLQAHGHLHPQSPEELRAATPFAQACAVCLAPAPPGPTTRLGPVGSLGLGTMPNS